MANLAGLLSGGKDARSPIGIVTAVDDSGGCTVDAAGESIRANAPPGQVPAVGEQVVIQRTQAGNFIVGRGNVRTRGIQTVFIKE
jgi:hypothetical protein